VLLLLLAILTVLPVRFLYPNLAPQPWRMPLIVGAFVWLGMMLWLLLDYPNAPAWIVWLSLLYPAFYLWLSYRLAVRSAPSGSPRPNSRSSG
jgi:phosphatidylcholine synthase